MNSTYMNKILRIIVVLPTKSIKPTKQEFGLIVVKNWNFMFCYFLRTISVRLLHSTDTLVWGALLLLSVIR